MAGHEAGSSILSKTLGAMVRNLGSILSGNGEDFVGSKYSGKNGSREVLGWTLGIFWRHLFGRISSWTEYGDRNQGIMPIFSAYAIGPLVVQLSVMERSRETGKIKSFVLVVLNF